MGTLHSGTTQKRRPAADRSPTDRIENGNLAVLDRDDDRDAPDDRPGQVERRDWRGEGVVGHLHTD